MVALHLLERSLIITRIINHLRTRRKKFSQTDFISPKSYLWPFFFSGYFTFITLSTLGYGDLVPAIPQSQALSIFIAISGQFYMDIVVAVIVGKFINKKD